MLILVGTVAALVLLGITALELYPRLRPGRWIHYVRAERTPWEELPASPHERQWHCLLPFRNEHRRDEAYLLDVQGEIRWLTAHGAPAPTLTGRVSLELQGYDGRRDGYFGAGIVSPGKTVWVEARVTAAGSEADLRQLMGGLLAVRYCTYTRRGEKWHEAHAILCAGEPQGQPEPRAYGGAWLQPLKTHLLTDEDDLAAVISRYTQGHARPGDIVVLAETAVGIVQGRYYRTYEMQVGWLASRLCYFFPTTGSLGTPFAMQALINEHGRLRVVAAAAIGIAGKLLGRPGLFYRLAGEQARLVDDLSGTMPPFDKYVVMGPRDPHGLVQELADRTGLHLAIVDANDIREAFVLAASPGVDVGRLREVMRSNPQGNDAQQTPLVLVRYESAGESLA